MKIQYSIQGCFSNTWVCEAQCPWVRVSEHFLTYQRRDGKIIQQKLKYIFGVEIKDDTEEGRL